MLDSIVAFIVPVVVIVLVLAVLAANIRVVQQSRAFVIERLGAFQTVWGVGLHFKIPFIERVAKNVSLKEQVVDFPPQPVITKDNVTMQIDTVIYFQITDPRLYTYGVENPMGALRTSPPPPCETSSATWSWTSPSPAVTTSTPRCGPSWMRPPTAGASRSTGWS